MNTVKPGWKTTEFWGKLILQALTILSLLGGMLDAHTVAYLTFGLEVVYMILRNVQKAIMGSTDLPDRPIEQPK